MKATKKSLLKKLEEFNKAAAALQMHWEDYQMQGHDDADDILVDAYPFTQSFDEMSMEIDMWLCAHDGTAEEYLKETS